MYLQLSHFIQGFQPPVSHLDGLLGDGDVEFRQTDLGDEGQVVRLPLQVQQVEKGGLDAVVRLVEPPAGDHVWTSKAWNLHSPVQTGRLFIK